jgi:uncharacterized protein YsxB (DUF464 family)
MLEVTFYRDERGRLTGLSALGHADFAEYGEDIVCAAVSAILQAARLGLIEYARLELDARQEPGALELSWRREDRDCESLRAIVATAELAVDQISRRFPAHVTLIKSTAEPGR